MKIKAGTIEKGIQRSVYNGNYKNSFENTVYNPKIKTIKSSNGTSVKLDRDDVNQGIFNSNNSSQRGYKNKINAYNGNENVFLNPKDFDKYRVGGYSYSSGTHHGGLVNNAKLDNSDYNPELGVAGDKRHKLDSTIMDGNAFPITSIVKKITKKRIKYVKKDLSGK